MINKSRLKKTHSIYFKVWDIVHTLSHIKNLLTNISKRFHNLFPVVVDGNGPGPAASTGASRVVETAVHILGSHCHWGGARVRRTMVVVSNWWCVAAGVRIVRARAAAGQVHCREWRTCIDQAEHARTHTHRHNVHTMGKVHSQTHRHDGYGKTRLTVWLINLGGNSLSITVLS